MEAAFVLLDTNTFLHYISLEQIVWQDLFPDQHVVLFICPAVIRELNKHKDAPRTTKLRDRAAAVLRKIDGWSDSPSPILLRDAVEVRFSIHDYGIDFAAHNLVREIADDHLIAALIELKAEASLAAPVLLTRDTGLKLKARAQGLSVASLPDTALLPDEVLPSEKKIKELETRVRELQNLRPKLRLAFPDGTDKLKLAFEPAGALSESDIAKRMADLRTKFTKLAEPVATESSVSEPTSKVTLYEMFSAASKLAQIDPEAIRKYNGDLEVFFSDHAEYLKELADFYAWGTRTAAINLTLINDGSCPADDVDIFMHFPDGFELFEDDDYKKEPEGPKPPRKPRSIFEEATSGMRVSALDFTNHSFYSPVLDRVQFPAGRSNVSGPKIKRTNSYDVKVNVEKAKHGIQEALDVIYLTFDSPDLVRGFAIDYRIHAANLPRPAKGTLSVIV